MSTVAIPRDRRKLAFLACGAAGFLLYTLLSLVLLRATALPAEAVALLAMLASVPPVFLLQKRVAFRHRGATLPSFAKYCLLQAVNTLLVAALAWLGRRAGLPDAANVVASAAIVVVVSWFALSRGVFRGAVSRDDGRRDGPRGGGR